MMKRSLEDVKPQTDSPDTLSIAQSGRSKIVARGQLRYERRKVRLDSEYARHALAAHGRCPGCGMGKHRPDNICDGKEKR